MWHTRFELKFSTLSTQTQHNTFLYLLMNLFSKEATNASLIRIRTFLVLLTLVQTSKKKNTRFALCSVFIILSASSFLFRSLCATHSFPLFLSLFLFSPSISMQILSACRTFFVSIFGISAQNPLQSMFLKTTDQWLLFLCRTELAVTRRRIVCD